MVVMIVRAKVNEVVGRNVSPMAQQLLVAQGFLIIEDSRLHSDIPHSLGFLRESDQPYTETFT
jgi:hypothetical protein